MNPMAQSQSSESATKYPGKTRTHDQFLPFWPWSLHHQHPEFDQCPCRLCCSDASLKISTVVCFVFELCHPKCCNKNLRHRLLCIAYACRNFESRIVSMQWSDPQTLAQTCQTKKVRIKLQKMSVFPEKNYRFKANRLFSPWPDLRWEIALQASRWRPVNFWCFKVFSDQSLPNSHVPAYK